VVKKSIGIFVIGIGILLFLSSLDLINMLEISEFLFPALLIMVSIVGTIERKKVDLFYLVMFIIGVIIVLTNLNIASENFIKIFIIPAVVILLGVRLFGLKQPKIRNVNSYTAIFGGIEEKNNDKNFKGCEVVAIFGGSNVDFRESEIKEDAVINVFCAFGGVELMFPKNYKLVTKGLPIFGALENKTTNEEKQKKQITINYTVLFGGIEIRD